MRRMAITRLVLIAVLASIAATLLGTTGAVARDPVPGRHVALEDDGTVRSSTRDRVQQRVRLADLPTATPARASYSPGLLAPSRPSEGPRQPSSLLDGAPIAFVQTDADPVTQAVATDGLAFAGFEPPDPWVAAGPDHIIQAVNTSLRVFDRTGVEVASASLEDFFGISSIPNYQAAVFDPRVIYDSLHSRWIVIEASFDCYADPEAGPFVGTGYLDVATSLTADPMGDWELFSWFYDDALPDYPGIGTTTDKIIFSANVYGLETGGSDLGCSPDAFNYQGSRMDVVAWSEWLGTGGVWVDHFTNSGFFTWRPALQTPATSATGHAVARAGAADVAYARITGSPAGGGVTTFTTTNLTTASAVSPFAVPPAPKQPGSPATIASAVDSRPTDAVWQNNQLAFVSTYPCNSRDCVRVSELSTTTATPTKLQDFLIGEAAADHYMGGVGYAGNGDLHVVWTRSSEVAGNYPSSYAAHQRVTDAANALSEPQLLKAGTGTYPGTRWGDYVGVAQDPQVPNAVWQANQYSAGASWWGTHVSQLQTGGSSYVPITPLRIVDSRIPTGVAGVFTSSVPQPFAVAGVGTIPANAIAVTGNVTVVGQQAAGYVSITPTATATPPNSTINFPLGDIRANNFTASLNASGDLAAVYKASTGKKAHIIVDITGYFVAGSGEATYTTITTKRVMDTRPGSHIGTATTFRHGIPQTISIPDDIDIPSTATAITANLTIVGQTRAGYLSVTPEPPVGNPLTSTINFPLGDIRANGLTADLNAAGDLSMTYVAVAGATTNVLLDITGYYVEDDAGGLLFYPLNPGRVLDSRPGIVLTGLSGAFVSSQARTLDVDGHWGVPALAKAITGNITVVGQTAAGYVSVTPVATNTPLTSTINFPLGDIRANGITVPLASGGTGLVYKAGTSKTTHLLLDVTGYFK